MTSLNRLKKPNVTNQRLSMTGVLVTLPLDDVTSKTQVRKRFTNLAELAESIKNEGLHTPITVTPANDEGKYVILQGERRWRASKLAGLETIEAIIRNPIQDDSKRIIAQLTENIQREEMSCEDIAEAVANLHHAGHSLASIAKSLGKNLDWAHVYYAVSDLPDYVKKIRDEHQINDPYILSPLKKMVLTDEKQAKETIESVLRNQVKLTRKVVRALNRELKAKLEEGSLEAKNKVYESTDSSLPKGMVAADEVCIYCWIKPIGENKKYFGMIANDRVMTDPEYICVNINGKYKVVSTQEIVIAGVKDRASPIDDLI